MEVKKNPENKKMMSKKMNCSAAENQSVYSKETLKRISIFFSSYKNKKGLFI